MSALVAAIIGGIVVGTLSGAPLVVTGPAAGLSAMILQYVQTYGLSALFQITVLAGAIQIVLAAARSARLIQKLPKSVVEGVLSAIGAVIVLGQLYIIMGQKIPGNPIKNIIGFPAAVATLFDTSTSLVPLHALAVGLLTIVTIQGWRKFATKLAWIPAALPGVLVATTVSFLFDIPRMSLSPIGPYLANAVSQSTVASFWTSILQYAVPAFGLAIVASAESLLTARSIDVLAAKRHMNLDMHIDRELLAQGLGNMVSGALGGLPMTGVMVRSAANLDAGATSRWSAVLHSVWIALFVMSAPEILNTIPLAALAAVLILTGVKLINLSHMTQAVKEHPAKAWVWPATACAVIGTDLLKGLGIGLAAAVIQHLLSGKKNIGAAGQMIAHSEISPATVNSESSPRGASAKA
jgi:MFS superfamily sulfate permease-like transporter